CIGRELSLLKNIPLNPDGLKVFSRAFYHGLQKLVFLWLSKSFSMHHHLMLAIYRGYPIIALDHPWELFIFALSLSVKLLLRGLPLFPIFSWFSLSQPFSFLTLARSVSICLCSRSTKESLSALESVSLCLSTKYRTTCSIFCCFFFNSPRVPLHSLEALDPSLHPSTANISLPINPILLQIKSTSRNNSMIASLLQEMKSAIVVKCG